MVSPLVLSDITEEELVRLAHLLAPMSVAGDFIALEGPLGAGKSVFARSFIRTAMGDEALDVPSPTYTLVQHYQPHSPYPEILHADLYRIEKDEDLVELGLDDVAESIVLLEWPERLGKRLPGNALVLSLKPGTRDTTRTVTLKPGGNWQRRLRNLHLIRA